MIFLNEDDIQAHLFQQYIDESKEDTPTVLDTLERQNIALIKAKLNGRYDVEKVFSHTDADRHYLIVKILSHLLIYDLVRRNAARKVPNDIAENYEWAMKYLECIKAGKEFPVGLNEITDEDGETTDVLLYGNNRNDNFYI